MAKGNKKPNKSKTKKPKKLKPFERPSEGNPDSAAQTPDVYYNNGTVGYPKPTTFDVNEFYIPMKVFPFNVFRDLLQNSKENYAQVQQSSVFNESSISEEQIIDDIFSPCPLTNKMVLLAESGNGKSTMARKLIKMLGEKYPSKLAFFIDLKEKKEERSLPELILPEDYQKGRREDGKKNVSAAIRVIFDNPDDCLFIIDSLEDYPDYPKIIEALISGESGSEIPSESFRDEDLSLPTWQWINELLIGNHLASRIILLARPETIAFHKTPNPFYHRRPGMGWNSLNEEYFLDSGFSINCIFGFSISDLISHFPDVYMHSHASRDTHEHFLEFISEPKNQSSFGYFCRKPFQMLLFYDTFQTALSQ